MRSRDSELEGDALKIWYARQRRAFWHKWRWVIITLGVVFVLTIIYDWTSVVASYQHWNSGNRAQLPLWWQSIGVAYLLARPMRDILQAVVFAAALALQAVYLNEAIPVAEVRVAVSEREISTSLFKKALIQPIATYSGCALLAFLLNGGMNLYFILGYEQHMRVHLATDIDTPTLKILGSLLFSLDAYSLIAAAICATLAQLWISQLIIQRHTLSLLSFLPGFIYMVYWTLIASLGLFAIFHIGSLFALFAFLPLTLFLLIIVIITARRYYVSNISVKGGKQWT